MSKFWLVIFLPGGSLHLNRPLEFFRCLLVKRSRLGFFPPGTGAVEDLDVGVDAVVDNAMEEVRPPPLLSQVDPVASPASACNDTMAEACLSPLQSKDRV